MKECILARGMGCTVHWRGHCTLEGGALYIGGGAPHMEGVHHILERVHTIAITYTVLLLEDSFVCGCLHSCNYFGRGAGASKPYPDTHQTWVRICVYICTYVYVCVSMYVCQCMYMSTCMCVHACTCICVYMCICVHVCAHCRKCVDELKKKHRLDVWIVCNLCTCLF